MLISSATANPVLTATLTKFVLEQSGLVGQLIAPLFLTGQQSAKYYVFDKENFVSIPTGLERAPSTPYQRTNLKLSDDSYSCVNRGIEVPVDDEERAKYRDAFSADEAAMRRARNVMIINHERRVKTLATAAGVPNSSASNAWDAYDNADSDPVGDTDVIKEVVRTGSGLVVNLMVISVTVFNALKEHPKILDKIKYSQRGVVTREILQEVFGIPQIAIAGAVENTAADGQTATLADIWGDKVFFGHVEPSSDLQAPNFARTFVWTAQSGPDGVLVESYREDNIQSDIHRAKQHTDEKMTGSELGYWLDSVLT